MSPRRWPDRIRDVLDAIAEIREFARDIGFEQFRADAKTRKAVLADLVIIGEAIAAIPDDVIAAHPEIPWSSMKALRNHVVHVYFDIDARIIWDTIQQDLPPLVEPLQLLLKHS